MENIDIIKYNETITEKLMKVVGGEWIELNKKNKKWGKI